MISESVFVELKEKYTIHPLVFLRSFEYAENQDELICILENLPELPFTWDYKKRRWTKVGV